MKCTHEYSVSVGEAGSHVVVCRDCNTELARTCREVWDLVASERDPAATAAWHIVNTNEAALAGLGRRIRP